MVWLELLSWAPNIIALVMLVGLVRRHRALKARMALVQQAAREQPVAGEWWRLPAGVGVKRRDDASSSCVELRRDPVPFEAWLSIGVGFWLGGGLALGCLAATWHARGAPWSIALGGAGLLLGYGFAALTTRVGERVVLVTATRDGVRLDTARPLLPGRAIDLRADDEWAPTGGASEREDGEPPIYVLRIGRGWTRLADKVQVDDVAQGAWLVGALEAWRARVPLS